MIVRGLSVRDQWSKSVDIGLLDWFGDHLDHILVEQHLFSVGCATGTGEYDDPGMVPYVLRQAGEEVQKEEAVDNRHVKIEENHIGRGISVKVLKPTKGAFS